MTILEPLEGREVTAEILPGRGVTIAGIPVPPLFAPEPRTAKRFAEFFGANIRNPNTRRAYRGAVQTFSAWYEAHGLHRLGKLQPLHVAAHLEELRRSFPTLP